jgi:hypothetical protein
VPSGNEGAQPAELRNTLQQRLIWSQFALQVVTICPIPDNQTAIGNFTMQARVGRIEMRELAGRESRYPWVVLPVVVLGTSMVLLSTVTPGVALPSIAADLGKSGIGWSRRWLPSSSGSVLLNKPRAG